MRAYASPSTSSPRPIAASSSSYPRRPVKRPHIYTSNGYSPIAQRDPSPPASAYFASFPTDPDSHADPIPLANAQEHFAYSTTLRRHHVEDALTTPIGRGGFQEWFNEFTYRLRRLWEQWRSGERELGLENGWGGREASRTPEPKEGISVTFASRSIEVSYWVISNFYIVLHDLVYPKGLSITDLSISPRTQLPISKLLEQKDCPLRRYRPFEGSTDITSSMSKPPNPL
jgi:hypothetical protein